MAIYHKTLEGSSKINASTGSEQGILWSHEWPSGRLPKHMLQVITLAGNTRRKSPIRAFGQNEVGCGGETLNIGDRRMLGVVSKEWIESRGLRKEIAYSNPANDQHCPDRNLLRVWPIELCYFSDNAQMIVVICVLVTNIAAYVKDNRLIQAEGVRK
jgi:hypothetical protein